MENKNLYIKAVEALKAAQSSLRTAQKQIEFIADNLGIPVDKVEDLAEQYSKTTVSDDEEVQIIEGIFDGQNMVGPNGKIFPVPANYASKSKLVLGDRLKLTIAENGAFIYKQIDPAPRKMLVGNLVLDGSQYQVISEGHSYNVLFASVTFFRAKVGDQITIIVPADGVSEWAAIENVIPSLENEPLAEV